MGVGSISDNRQFSVYCTHRECRKTIGYFFTRPDADKFRRNHQHKETHVEKVSR